MKKITLLFLALTAMLNVANAQNITVFDFDGTTPAFAVWSDSFVSLANPVIDAVNPSANVGKYTHNNMWADVAIDLSATPIDLRLYPSFTIKVYSPNAGTLAIDCRNAAGTTLNYYNTAQSVTAGWNLIPVSTPSTQSLAKIVLRFNYGGAPAGGPADVIYLDDLTFIKSTNPSISLYSETFFATWSAWASWTGAPSTQAGNWFGGINLTTVGDAPVTLDRWWDAGEHRLKLTPTDAAVTIPNINIAGFNNLSLSLDPTASPSIDVSADGGAWTPLTLVAGLSALPTAISTISLRINPPTTGSVAIDFLKVTGTQIPLATQSNQLTDNSIKVYPNPSTSEFNVSKSEGPLQVSVFDLLGRKVESAKSASSQVVVGSSLKAGVYIVKVEGANAKDSKSFKIIKE